MDYEDYETLPEDSEDEGEEDDYLLDFTGEDFEDDCCSECPCFRMVCKGCCHEGGD